MRVSLKNTRLICILWVLISPIGLFGQKGIIHDCEENLHKAIQDNDYQSALMYVNILDQRDTMSIIALLDCADCYIGLHKYQECISFCDKWIERDPYYKSIELFSDMYGVCYFFLDQYSLAADYLGRYISWMEQKEYNVSAFHHYLYSTSLYRTNQFSRACKYFKVFFKEAASMEDLPPERLYLTKDKELYGNAFYDYAYSLFLLGKELIGLKSLECSVLCGNKEASSDLAILRGCKTFATDLELGKRYINEFEEYINKFDCRAIIRTLNKDNPGSFWRTIPYYNANYQNLCAALKKERKSQTLEQAEKEIDSSQASFESQLILCTPYKKGEIEYNLEKMLFGNQSLVKDFRIYPSDEINAFASPYGQIYLTEGLVDRFHCNNSLLIGVCAHEMAHFLFKHSLASVWRSAEEERKAALSGALAAGLSAVAMAGAGIYAASSGVEYGQDYWEYSSKISRRLMDSFMENANLFRFKYSRSQEIESDIIAYRFCDYLGIGGYSYIMALQLLGEDDFYLQADPESDHPTVAYRVLLLKYLFKKDKEQEAIEIQNRDIEWLFRKLSEAGKYNLGSFDSFRKSLKKDSNIKKYYDAAIAEGLNVGTYEVFYQHMKIN